jgi:hypothetical protein
MIVTADETIYNSLPTQKVHYVHRWSVRTRHFRDYAPLSFLISPPRLCDTADLCPVPFIVKDWRLARAYMVRTAISKTKCPLFAQLVSHDGDRTAGISTQIFKYHIAADVLCRLSIFHADVSRLKPSSSIQPCRSGLVQCKYTAIVERIRITPIRVHHRISHSNLAL